MSVLGAREITLIDVAVASGVSETADTQVEPLLSADELSLQMCGLIERYPETAASLKLLMDCFGDSSPSLQASDMDAVDTDSPVVDVLLNGPLCADPEAVATVGNYMYVKRKQQLEAVYQQITQHISLPSLFSVLSILEAPMSPHPIERPDRYAVLSQQTSLLQRTIHRHGLEGPADMSPSREHAAWHEFTRAARHLEDDPPTTTEAGNGHNNRDFLTKQLAAVAAMRKPIAGLVNAIGDLTGQDSGTGQEVIIPAPYTLVSVTVLEINHPAQSEAGLVTDCELAVTVRGSDGKVAVMPLAMLCESHAVRREYLDDETLFTVATLDALINCSDVEEFKTQFAATCVNLARGESVAVHIDADDTTLSQLFSESDALSSLTNLSCGEDDFDSHGLELWPVRSSLEGQPDQMYVSNVDRRTFETRGTVDSQSERSVYGRMVCFDPGLLLDVNTEMSGDSYDLELRMGLPRSVSSSTDQYICPQVPGFTLVGCYPAEDSNTDQYVLRYVAASEDPYEPREIAVLPERLESLSQRLENIGLSNAADQLRQTECRTLDAVYAVLEQSLVYGNGWRKITLQAEDLEDLEFFVEDGCLVGVCSLFAALAVFSIQELLPESEPRIIGGHRLNPWTISADAHAQALFTVNGRQQITDLHARGQRNAHSEPENDSSGQPLVATTPIEAFGITAKNMFTRLHGALMNKYRMPDEASLTKHLVKLPETNFARQLYSLVVQARSITGNATYDEISPLLQQRTQLADLLSHWQSTTTDTRRQLAGTFGTWSDQEADFFRDILKQLEQSLQLT